MAIDVRTEITIRRPVDQVSGYAADPSHAPQWYRNIDSVDWKSPPPARAGTQVAFVARFLGRTLEYTYQIAELVPGQRLVMRTAQGPFPMETTYTWEPAGEDATRMTLRNRGAPTGFPALVAPLMASAVRRANRADLARLKSLLEAGADVG